MHKTANMLANLPKSQQPKAKRALQEIWMAETKAIAELAFDAFVESDALKYAKAGETYSPKVIPTSSAHYFIPCKFLFLSSRAR